MNRKSAEPLISCICVTTVARAWCLPLAIDCFLAQTYENKELIIVTTVDPLPDGIVPKRPDITYHHTHRDLILGDKRNLAIEIASGAAIASWDDDDWHGPNRLAKLAPGLSMAPIVGWPELLFYDLNSGAGWRYHYTGRRVYVLGASMVMARDTWRDFGRYQRAKRGEDTQLMLEACRYNPVARVNVLADYVAMRHGANTENRLPPRPPRYTRDGMVPHIMGQTLDLYAAAYRNKRCA